MKKINPEDDMVNYGIQNEESHIRAHVCPVVKRIYVYPTREGKKTIENSSYDIVSGYQSGYKNPTAKGYLVPPDDIERCVELKLASEEWEKIQFSKNSDTTVKGKEAIALVSEMLKKGLFPLPAKPQVIDDEYMQIEGQDIILDKNALSYDETIIQVKCDYKGGRRKLGGTGNLFLQIAEKNPFNKY